MKYTEIRALLPKYAAAFTEDIKKTKAEATVTTTARDVLNFLEYIVGSDTDYRGFTTRELPYRAVTDKDDNDIRDYLISLSVPVPGTHKTRPVSVSTTRRIRSSLSAFFSWLSDHGYTGHVPTDKVKILGGAAKPEPLTEDEARRLIDGVLSNAWFPVRLTTAQGPACSVREPDETTRLRREKHLLRNAAILSLIVYAGLYSEEIAALDLSDCDGDKLRLRKKDSVSFVTLPKPAHEALSRYLNGDEVPEYLYIGLNEPDVFLDFCRGHCDDQNLLKTAVSVFGPMDDRMTDLVQECCRFFRTNGRSSYPQMSDAVFLSNRGRRMSVRMIQQMTLDATAAYLPERNNGLGISCLDLRAAAVAAAAADEEAMSVLTEKFRYMPVTARKRIRTGKK